MHYAQYSWFSRVITEQMRTFFCPFAEESTNLNMQITQSILEECLIHPQQVIDAQTLARRETYRHQR